MVVENLLTIGLLLACPLVMIWCMRGMGKKSTGADAPISEMSPQAARARLAELQREELQLEGQLAADEMEQGGAPQPDAERR